MITSTQSAGVAPEVNLRITQARKHTKRIHPGSEKQGRQYQKSKTEVSVAPRNRTYVLQKFKNQILTTCGIQKVSKSILSIWRGVEGRMSSNSKGEFRFIPNFSLELKILTSLLLIFPTSVNPQPPSNQNVHKAKFSFSPICEIFHIMTNEVIVCSKRGRVENSEHLRGLFPRETLFALCKISCSLCLICK